MFRDIFELIIFTLHVYCAMLLRFFPVNASKEITIQKVFKNVNICISHELFFFLRCTLITATACQPYFHALTHVI